jgi:sarcosine oxidase subunit beta
VRSKRADAVIIGGGVIGASIAFHLAQRKTKVVLLEQGDLASGTSGACDGLVFLQSKKPGIHLKLALASKARFDELQDQMPRLIEYENNGGLVVIESEAELEAMRAFVAEQRKNGLDVSLLDGLEARELEPHLSGHIRGATYSPLDGQVNPIALTIGFALEAERLGAEIATDTVVTGIKVERQCVRGVSTNQGTVETEVVVNAAGVFAPEIGRMVNLKIPIEPRRGQVLVTERCDRIVSRCLISAGYIAAKFEPELAKREGEGMSLEQTASGNLLLGSTREFVGFDRHTSLEGVQQIAARTSRILPCLKKMNIIRTFAGLRPYTPDGLPILGPVNDLRGFFMAAGHEGDGIALAPITGMLIAQLLVDSQPSIPLDDLSLHRFTREGNIG